MQLETQIKVKNLDALPSMLRKIVLFIILHLYVHCTLYNTYDDILTMKLNYKFPELKDPYKLKQIIVFYIVIFLTVTNGRQKAGNQHQSTGLISQVRSLKVITNFFW